MNLHLVYAQHLKKKMCMELLVNGIQHLDLLHMLRYIRQFVLISVVTDRGYKCRDLNFDSKTSTENASNLQNETTASNELHPPEETFQPWTHVKKGKFYYYFVLSNMRPAYRRCFLVLQKQRALPLPPPTNSSEANACNHMQSSESDWNHPSTSSERVVLEEQFVSCTMYTFLTSLSICI